LLLGEGHENLKEGARGTTGGRHRVQRALVVAEFALALTLLAGGASPFTA
jgi:hypothetical protein